MPIFGTAYERKSEHCFNLVVGMNFIAIQFSQGMASR